MTAKVVKTKKAGAGHQVVTVQGGPGTYRRTPCGGCPWRVDQTGEFPKQAFVISASTAYDMAQNTFACHESGKEKPSICAGFLLRGAEHNLAVRLGHHTGRYPDPVRDGGHALHPGYTAMAVANGVPPTHKALVACRKSSYELDPESP
jgi:hypothetical protein